MKSLQVAEILELPVADRLRLVELIWDSIAAAPEAVAIPEDLAADLDRRLAEFKADPASGTPWDEVRRRVLEGTWRTV